MRLFASAAVLATLLATSALAQAPADQVAAQPEAAAGKKDEKAAKAASGVVCHREIPTGSQFPVKVCTTSAERKAQNKAAQKAQESMQGPTPVIPN